MTPEDALLIIRGWLDSKSELMLSASMINFSVYSRCRVVSVVGGTVTLWPVKDGAAAFSFSVDSPHLEIKYSELREFKGKSGLENVPEDAWLKSALVVSLALRELDPLTPWEATVERIVLMEA
jgi:hypothetical protein